MLLARRRQLAQPRDDPRVLEEHGRDEHRRRALVVLGREPLGERLGRPRGQPRRPRAAPPRRAVPSAASACGTRRSSSPGEGGGAGRVRRGTGARARRCSGRARARRRALRARAGTRREPDPPFRTRGPLLVGVERRVVPGLDRRPRGRRPARPGASARSGAGARRRGTPSSASPAPRLDQSSERTAQRSGKNGLWSVVRR